MTCLAVSILFVSCNWGGSGGNEKVIVCLGDGLTIGSIPGAEFGVNDPAHSYPVYLQAMLDDQVMVSYTVTSAGAFDDTSVAAYDRLENDVLAKDPDIVIITLGLMDFRDLAQNENTEFHSDWINGIDTMGDNLGKIIDRLDDGNRRIYVANSLGNGIVSMFLEDVSVITTSEAVEKIHNTLNGLCSANPQTRTYIPDVWTGIWGNTNFQPSQIGAWPNAAGYERMAKTYYDAMMK